MRFSSLAAALCFVAFGCGETENSPPPVDGGAGSAGSSGSAGISAGSSGSAGTSAGSSGTGGSGASGGGSGSAGSGASLCTPPCGEARTCCDAACTNLQNDPRNCGRCGRTCEQNTFCTGGECVSPPCEATCEAGASCCGTECCGTGQLCCDPQGPIEIGPRCTAPDDRGTCAMGCAPLCKCASPDTPIATAAGDVPIGSLRAGDLVYSVDRSAIRLVPILRTQQTPAHNHRVVRLTLVTGAVLEISALHPTADGRSIGQLVSGGSIDGIEIRDVQTIPYQHAATYDILPDSNSGTYFAAGVLLGSTLAPTGTRTN